MGEQQEDSVQNRFSGYLVAAVANRRIRYHEQVNRRHNKEDLQIELVGGGHCTDFEAQFCAYMLEQAALFFDEPGTVKEMAAFWGNIRLVRAIDRLKERERRILFARVFGELNYAELGKRFGMSPKQAEQAYFYIIRKVRKGLR